MNLMTVILVLTVVFLIGVLWGLKRLARRSRNEMERAFQGKNVLEMHVGANFFGQESLGSAQVRGNGTLVLTDEGVYFKMWLPARTFHVRLSSVRATSIVKSHLGKTKFRPLLKVTFRNQKGKEDSVAWLVPEPKKWAAAIQDRLSSSNGQADNEGDRA
jgi:hypothetical protein